MGLVRKIKAGLVKVSVNDFIGEDGNVFFDIDDGVMRLSDGTTPGGIPLSSGGEGGASTFRQLLDTPSSFTGQGGNFLKVNPQGSAIEFVDVPLFDGQYSSLTGTPNLFDPSSISQGLIPDTDITYDLGSESARWRDLYLSGNTIFLGTVQISKNNEGGVNLPNNSRINGRKVATDIKDLDDSEGRLTQGGGSGTSDYNELTNLPTLFSGAYADLIGKPTIPVDVSDLTDTGSLLGSGSGTTDYNLLTNLPDLSIYQVASRAFSGDYNDLTNKPILFSGSYTDLTNLPDLAVYQLAADAFSGSYTDLTNLPDLAVYQLAADAFSGSYTDLTDTPTLFSGAYADLTGLPTLVTSYNDLTDTPTIPVVPTTISAFTNDSGYITDYTVTQEDVTQHQSALSITESQISDLGSYLTSVAFTDLTSKPTTLDGYGITDAFDGNYNSLINLPTLFSGSYTDLINKPIIPVDINELTDVDSLLASTFDGSFTSLTDVPTTLAEYGIDIEVNTAINTAVNDVLDGAPELLDSLNELAAAVGDDPNFVTTINSAISLKANSADLSIVATTNNYKDLDDLPIIPADVTELNDALKSIIPNVEAEIFAMTVMIG